MRESTNGRLSCLELGLRLGLVLGLGLGLGLGLEGLGFEGRLLLLGVAAHEALGGGAVHVHAWLGLGLG